MTGGRLIAGRYELTEPLGKGAMGQVWGGRDLGLGGRHIAVKLMHSGQMASLSGTADLEELRRRFERECQVTARIDHPGLVTVYDAGRDDDELFLVMQRVEGSDLGDHLAEHEHYPWQWSAAVAAQMCAALVAVHAVPVIHRDLKPGNAIVRPDGRVIILDLGIAAVASVGDTTRLTRTGALIGTPVYMAPEQAIGDSPVGPAADLYALGVLLYELLTGRLPFEAPEASGLLYKKLHELPVPVRHISPEVPEALATLVARLLDKEPTARPADAYEVYSLLAPLLPRPYDQAHSQPSLPTDPTRPFREPMAPWPVPRGVAPPPVTASGFGPPPVIDLPGTLEEVRGLLAAGRYTQVADLLGRALPAAVAEHGDPSPVVRTLRKQFAATLVDTAQYARALPEIRRLIQDLTAERGPYDPVVTQLRQDESLCLRHLSG
ncbi:serine/threonine protein kinase [Streptomyces sp. N2-109]|uniref:non-specific serine/threonine protein kinase n=1 Tax=Streptomyces gossypii TaxID=2883101 RepID=A0ABT2JYK2_9ACTN|nr:serine/threonine-protein kinase [Streptomyces gossypii]MCT2592980.1 serine/threonine protein kinase [Streptomyces gossypii]MCT2593713.1 serine/threonine protein kinase [Streptomyces gossypii]